MRQLIVASRLGRTEYQLLLMKISWWDRNVRIRYKCLVVIDEFLTVSLYQPNESISRDQDSVMEFGFEPVCDQIWAISTCRDISNLVTLFVGWQERHTAHKKSVPLIPKHSAPKQLNKNNREPASLGPAGKAAIETEVVHWMTRYYSEVRYSEGPLFQVRVNFWNSGPAKS